MHNHSYTPIYMLAMVSSSVDNTMHMFISDKSKIHSVCTMSGNETFHN